MGIDTDVATSFDLFGTLVTVSAPSDPGRAVAIELERRHVPVPEDWAAAYRQPHGTVAEGVERPLSDHVTAALESRGVEVTDHRDSIRDALMAAFDPQVRTRPAAAEAVAAARTVGPVGVLSNCSVRGVAGRTLERSALDPNAFDAVVTSVECGWRKPDPRAFDAVATRLDVPVSDLVHVGDDPETDGGATAAGATAVVLHDTPLEAIPTAVERGTWPP